MSGCPGDAASALRCLVIHLAGTPGLAQTGPILSGPQLAAIPATANVTTSLALGSGSIFALSIQGARGPVGIGYDTVIVKGSLTLSASALPDSQITMSLTGLAADGTAGLAANFDATHDSRFVLVTAQGGIAGFNPAFTVDTAGMTWRRCALI